MYSISLIAFTLVLGFVYSEVTVVPIVQTIYDRTPKLRIQGMGFDAPEADINVELSSSGGILKIDKDFILTKVEDGIVLKLLGVRRWVNMDGRNPPVGLVLNSVSFGERGTNLLGKPVIVAMVLATPTVKESTDTLYMTASNRLVIKGSGFAGAKDVDLFFDPPLYKEIEYEVSSSFPLQENEIELRLRHNYKWRKDAGALVLVGIDTGGGPAKVNGDDGFVVAIVQEDLESHDVSASNTADEQVIYHDTPSLKIKGSGFVEGSTQVRFDNGLLGKGVNYTIMSTAEDQLNLMLTPGSFWRKNVVNLPGYLTVVAVNVGGGFVNVGPINALKGQDVAKVFERPQVFSGVTRLYRTHTHELHIQGVGFPKVWVFPQLEFNLPLIANKDYTVSVESRTELIVTLMDGREWGNSGAELKVTRINTRGDSAGWVTLSGDGVHVAQIVDDVDSDETGGVEIYPMGQRVYASKLSETIEVSGSGFTNSMGLVFEPTLMKGVDYDLTFVNRNRVQLTLRSGKKWRNDAGFLVCKAVTVGGKSYNLAGGSGIRVATVLADPIVATGTDNIHETQSKVIVIRGSGFTNVADVSVTLNPTMPGAYKVLSVSEDEIRLQLKPDFDWLPSYLSLADTEKSIPLLVTMISTGAGDIFLDKSVVVGNVIQDREGVFCDDSCDFAFDGVCDDGTADEMYYNYWEYGGYYMDDDIAGYYAYGQYANGDVYGDDQYNMYDDYYMEDDGQYVSACLQGTDCTDCGGVDAIPDYTSIDENDPEAVSCTNTCPYARDGQCDDPRAANYCTLGTDCQDCGPVGADNFTIADDDGWWDDDDDYWNFNDGNFLDQAKGLERNRHRVKVEPAESVGASTVFLTMLEGMVYTIGGIFFLTAVYLFMRWQRGQSIPCIEVFNPDSAAASMDFEMQPTRRMPITPDVIRT